MSTKFWPCDLDFVFNLLIENFNLGYIFWLVGTHECFFWQDLSVGTNKFDLATVTLVFYLHIENFNDAYIFSIECFKILIFHECLLV
jgi:hypothetical protein